MAEVHSTPSAGPPTKRCTKCGKVLPLDQFGTIDVLRRCGAGRKEPTGRRRPHSHCKVCRVAHLLAWRKAHPEENKAQRRNRLLRTWYGLSPADYAWLLDQQNKVCAICEKTEIVKRKDCDTPNALAVDHDHATGKIRGLLCCRCNRALGRFGDDPELFEKAAAYLRKHRQ